MAQHLQQGTRADLKLIKLYIKPQTSAAWPIYQHPDSFTNIKSVPNSPTLCLCKYLPSPLFIQGRYEDSPAWMFEHPHIPLNAEHHRGCCHHCHSSLYSGII